MAHDRSSSLPRWAPRTGFSRARGPALAPWRGALQLAVATVAGLGALVLLVPAASGSASAAPGTGAPGASGTTPACPGPVAPGDARCHAVVLDDPAAWQGGHVGAEAPGTTQSRKPSGGGSPSGYGPCDLESAYALSSTCSPLGSGQTVAIVDAYDDPTAASDLAVYRSTYKLPPVCSSTVTTGCVTFTKVYASGVKPSNNTGWAEEMSLDVDMVSAICANCNILLVEAPSSSLADLAAAFRLAASTPGVVAVSNSYGGSDSSSDATFDGPGYYDFAAYPSLAVTASSGDSGYGVEYPASSPYVTAVGGTTLSLTSGVWSETVWSGAGSGCSKYEPRPSWQPLTSLCSGRTVADVSADANPNTGVSVYDTDGEPGWMVFGGTSVASPIVASVYALAGTHSPQALYGDSALRHISSGTNARRCTSYLCNAAYSLSADGGSSNTLSWSPVLAGEWYNGPTGNGTPQGSAGF
jgi:subtilase family serine protease